MEPLILFPDKIPMKNTHDQRKIPDRREEPATKTRDSWPLLKDYSMVFRARLCDQFTRDVARFSESVKIHEPQASEFSRFPIIEQHPMFYLMFQLFIYWRGALSICLWLVCLKFGGTLAYNNIMNFINKVFTSEQNLPLCNIFNQNVMKMLLMNVVNWSQTNSNLVFNTYFLLSGSCYAIFLEFLLENIFLNSSR